MFIKLFVHFTFIFFIYYDVSLSFDYINITNIKNIYIFKLLMFFEFVNIK